ncbi:MAG: DUF58 domain-containing protein [Candidatus Nanohaloarchaea archaeon]
MIEVDFIEELDRFHLALKKNSTEIREGEQQSHSTGQGMIFEDHKKYIPGDDIRRMDWKAYARTGDLFVKRFEEEKSITLHVLVDRSSSMDFGNVNKYDYAAKLGLAAAHMVSHTNDRFRYAVFSETVTDISHARRKANLGDMVETLNSLRKTPESLIERCVTEYSKRIENESAVIIISDFLVDVEKVEEAVKRLKGSDVILVNTLSGEELDPDMRGEKILMDPESDSRLRTYLSRKTRDEYREELEQHTDALEEVAEKYGANYIKVSTEDEFFDSFLKVWKLLND